MLIADRTLTASGCGSCAVVLALLLGPWPEGMHRLWGQEPDRDSVAPGAIAEHAVAGNLLRIVSGEYTARGSYSERPYRRSAWLESARHKLPLTNPADPESGSQYSMVIRGTFDFAQGLFSFRCQRERMSDAPNEFLERFPEVWYVSQPHKAIHVTRGADSHRPYVVGVHLPQEPSRINRFLRPIFDVRTLPLISLGHLEDSIGDADLVERLVSQPDEVDVAGTLTICKQRNETREFTWWCDAQQGYQVIRTREAELPDPKYPDREIAPLSFSNTTWVQHGDVWVPATHNVRTRRGTVEREMDLAFAWGSVNKPIDSHVFDWRHWDLPKESAVREQRLEGNNIFTIHRFGIPHEIPIPKQTVTSPYSLRRFLLMMNAAVVAGILGYLSRFMIRQTWPRAGR